MDQGGEGSLNRRQVNPTEAAEHLMMTRPVREGLEMPWRSVIVLVCSHQEKVPYVTVTGGIMYAQEEKLKMKAKPMMNK